MVPFIFITITIFVMHLNLIHAERSYHHSVKRKDPEGLRKAGCNDNGTLIAKGLCINDDYDIFNAPDQAILPITEQGIHVTIWEAEVLQIDEKQGRLQMDFRIALLWRDDRVITNSTLLSKFSWAYSSTPGLSIHWYDRIPWNDIIWQPNAIKFNNAYQQKLLYKPVTFLHVVAGDAISSDSKKYEANATFLYSQKDYTVGLRCPIDFSNFPMDTQTCRLQLTNEFIRELKILINVIDHEAYESFPTKKYVRDGFDIITAYDQNNATRNSSEVSYVEITLNMRRLLFPFISQYYAPSIAIVMISHVSFIIPPSSIPGRLGFVATLFLTMTNILIDSNVSSHCFKYMVL